MKLRVFVDDITALVKGKCRSGGNGEKGGEKVERRSGEKGLKLSVTENGMEGKSTMIASCGFLENELNQFSREEGVTLADSVETLGVDLTTRVKKLGVKENRKEESAR